MGIIRLVLALSVLHTHSGADVLGQKLMPGYIAVESFYIISGFYMAMILNEKYVGKGEYGVFLQQRFFRLYPTYYVVFLLCLAGDWIASAAHLSQHDNASYIFTRLGDLQPQSLLALAATNLLIIGQDIVMFLGIDPHGNLFFTPDYKTVSLPAWHFLAVPQAWSLGVEITFYLLAPFIVRRSVMLQTGLIALSLALRLFFRFHFHLHDDPWSYRFFPFEIVFFLVGSLSYRSYASHRTLYENFGARYGWTRWIFVLFLCNYSFVCGELSRGFQAFIAMAVLMPFYFVATKKNSFDKFCGELSYPLYLSHVLTLSIVGNWIAPIPGWLLGFYYSLAAIAVACPITLWVDYPVERFRHSLSRYPKR